MYYPNKGLLCQNVYFNRKYVEVKGTLGSTDNLNTQIKNNLGSIS